MKEMSTVEIALRRGESCLKRHDEARTTAGGGGGGGGIEKAEKKGRGKRLKFRRVCDVLGPQKLPLVGACIEAPAQEGGVLELGTEIQHGCLLKDSRVKTHI